MHEAEQMVALLAHPTQNEVRFDDLQGEIAFWGPAASLARSMTANQAGWGQRLQHGNGPAPLGAPDDEPFGDLNGPLGYWGPARRAAAAPAHPVPARLRWGQAEYGRGKRSA